MRQNTASESAVIDPPPLVTLDQSSSTRLNSAINKIKCHHTIIDTTQKYVLQITASENVIKHKHCIPMSFSA